MDEPKKIHYLKIEDCSRCTGADPKQMYEALLNFSGVELIFESHFSVHVFMCSDCTQRWICVWTEIIEWEGGHDSLYTSILPVTDPEAEELIAQRNEVSMNKVEELGQSRRWLQRDYCNGEIRVRWMDGDLRILEV